MIDFRKYRVYEYQDGARGPVKIDCWGLVRQVRHELGYALLPSFSECRNTDPRAFTRAYEQQSAKMEQAPPEMGSIAAAFRGRICVHVGIVVTIDSRLMVLDIDAGRNVECSPIPEFEAKYGEVLYYRDKSIS